ncbi:hypothetical protein FOA52_001379 [Chlamydomonas sp. UWO 241]|nr:hypothetical protein FOA52_001379 [Chlamydomonas sp. UWO 241]
MPTPASLMSCGTLASCACSRRMRAITGLLHRAGTTRAPRASSMRMHSSQASSGVSLSNISFDRGPWHSASITSLMRAC